MPIAFRCPSCIKLITISDAAAGRPGKCPHCQAGLVVPRPAPVLQDAPARRRSASPLFTSVTVIALSMLLGGALTACAFLWLGGRAPAVVQVETGKTLVIKRAAPAPATIPAAVPSAKATAAQPQPPVQATVPAPQPKEADSQPAPAARNPLPKVAVVPRAEPQPATTPAPPVTPAQPAEPAKTKPAVVTAQPKTGLPKDRPQVPAALTWLAKNQMAGGSWSDGLADNDQMREMVKNAPPEIQARILQQMQTSEQPTTLRVVATAYCGLALLASGKAEYYSQIDRAAAYVAANLFDDPRSRRGENDPFPGVSNVNWQVAIGSLFYCEYCAALRKRGTNRLTPDKRALLEKIAKECLDRMEPSGGWGHSPRVVNPLGYLEMEIMSNWMLLTLGACRRLDVKVPQDRLEVALQFIENCCYPGQGGVGYSPRPGQKGSTACPSKTGGAITVFALLDQKQHPLYPRMAAYWREHVGESANGHGSTSMGLLCSALGARQLGEEDWSTFAAQFLPLIQGVAEKDGTFRHLTGTGFASDRNDNRQGKAYNTAIYTLILLLDQGHLSYLGQRH